MSQAHHNANPRIAGRIGRETGRNAGGLAAGSLRATSGCFSCRYRFAADFRAGACAAAVIAAAERFWLRHPPESYRIDS
jgi:hypothetical protein